MRRLAVRFSLVHQDETFVSGRTYEVDDERAEQLLKVTRQKGAHLVHPFVDMTSSGAEVKAEDFVDPHSVRRPRYTDDARVGRKPKKKVEAAPEETPTPKEEEAEEIPPEAVESEESTPDDAEVTAPVDAEEDPKTEE